MVSRCVLFQGSLELAWHNNLYRAFNMPPNTGTEIVSHLHELSNSVRVLGSIDRCALSDETRPCPLQRVRKLQEYV